MRESTSGPPPSDPRRRIAGETPAQVLACDFSVVERNGALAVHLGRLVPFARHQDDVAGCGEVEGGADGTLGPRR